MNRQSHRDWVLEALEEHEVALTRYAWRLLREVEQARDVVQHAFLKLCEQSPEKIAGGERKWLYAVCRNRALDLLRTKDRKAWTEAKDRDQADRPEVIGREPDPADSVAAEEMTDLLRRLLQDLPAMQREAIELWCDGFSNREIAEIIQRQEGHVRVLVHRGFASLREHPQVRAWLKESSRHAPREVVPRESARASPR